MAETAAQVLGRAAPSLVAQAFARLGPVTSLTSLLDANNGADPAVTLAAEQINHLQDAFRYFSSSLNAFLTNSGGNALHFAYYSQLRSALSLFSGYGVRLKQGDNRVLGANGALSSFKLASTGTHPMTWDLWAEWSKTAQASDILLDGVKLMHGLTLRDFTALPDLASMVFGAWGWDLFAISTGDRDARNRASYNVFPNEPLKKMLIRDTEVVFDIWELLLGSGTSVGFDAALIEFFITRLTVQLGGNDHEDFKRRLRESASQQTGVPAARIEEILRAVRVTKVFDRAADSKSEVENVLSRAFLLLRIATLAVQLNATAAVSSVVTEWVTNWLFVLGLYDPATSDLADIQDDYAAALGVSVAVAGDAPSALWTPDQVLSTVRLTRAEAFAAWALVA